MVINFNLEEVFHNQGLEVGLLMSDEMEPSAPEYMRIVIVPSMFEYDEDNEYPYRNIDTFGFPEAINTWGYPKYVIALHDDIIVGKELIDTYIRSIKVTMSTTLQFESKNFQIKFSKDEQ